MKKKYIKPSTDLCILNASVVLDQHTISNPKISTEDYTNSFTMDDDEGAVSSFGTSLWDD